MARRRKPNAAAAGPSLFDGKAESSAAAAPPLLGGSGGQAAAAEPTTIDYYPRGLPADRLAALKRGDELRVAGKALPLCWLPPPQERIVLPPMPGKKIGGQLWFEK